MFGNLVPAQNRKELNGYEKKFHPVLGSENCYKNKPLLPHPIAQDTRSEHSRWNNCLPEPSFAKQLVFQHTIEVRQFF